MRLRDFRDTLPSETFSLRAASHYFYITSIYGARRLFAIMKATFPTRLRRAYNTPMQQDTFPRPAHAALLLYASSDFATFTGASAVRLLHDLH